MTITLRQLLDASDMHKLNGYEVEGYVFPDDGNTTVTLIINTGSLYDCELEFDMDQEVTLSYGSTIIRGPEGEGFSLECYVQRPLTEADLQ